MYCRIRKAKEDMTPRSPLVAEAWRAQVHWVDQAWRVFCYLCTPTLFSSGLIIAWGRPRGFSPSSLVASSITRLGVILCLHLFSLTLVLYFYCLLFMCMHQSRFGDCASFTLVPHLDKLEQKQSSRNFKIWGLNKLMCFSTNQSSFKREPTSSAQGMFSLFIYSLSSYSRKKKTDLTIGRSLTSSPWSPLTVFFFLFRSSNHHYSPNHSAY